MNKNTETAQVAVTAVQEEIPAKKITRDPMGSSQNLLLEQKIEKSLGAFGPFLYQT